MVDFWAGESGAFAAASGQAVRTRIAKDGTTTADQSTSCSLFTGDCVVEVQVNVFGAHGRTDVQEATIRETLREMLARFATQFGSQPVASSEETPGDDSDAQEPEEDDDSADAPAFDTGYRSASAAEPTSKSEDEPSADSSDVESDAIRQRADLEDFLVSMFLEEGELNEDVYVTGVVFISSIPSLLQLLASFSDADFEDAALATAERITSLCGQRASNEPMSSEDAACILAVLDDATADSFAQTLDDETRCAIAQDDGFDDKARLAALRHVADQDVLLECYADGIFCDSQEEVDEIVRERLTSLPHRIRALESGLDNSSSDEIEFWMRAIAAQASESNANIEDELHDTILWALSDENEVRGSEEEVSQLASLIGSGALSDIIVLGQFADREFYEVRDVLAQTLQNAEFARQCLRLLESLDDDDDDAGVIGVLHRRIQELDPSGEYK
ncbi:MAG: hypothetical protein ABIG71_00075 [Candidatus Uhrbacteria bacterium]